MGKTRSAFVGAIVLAGMCASATASAQSRTPSTGERYGFGMFKHQGRTFAGLVMRFPVEPQQIGGVVVELAPAARAAGQTGVPTDVMSIIEQWEKVGPQLKKIVAHVGPLIDKSRPAYVHDYKAMDVLAPIVPRLALYGFGNYRPDPNRPNAPATPSASPTPSGPRSPAPSILGLWERDPERRSTGQSPHLPDPQHPGGVHRRRGAGDHLARGQGAQPVRVRVRAGRRGRKEDAPRAGRPGEGLHHGVHDHQRHLRSPGPRGGRVVVGHQRSRSCARARTARSPSAPSSSPRSSWTR